MCRKPAPKSGADSLDEEALLWVAQAGVSPPLTWLAENLVKAVAEEVSGHG